MIYDDLRGEFLLDPEPPLDATQAMPAVVAMAEDLTHTDYLVRTTNNGLRPADLALEQPPQDPAWRPDAHR